MDSQNVFESLSHEISNLTAEVQVKILEHYAKEGLTPGELQASQEALSEKVETFNKKIKQSLQAIHEMLNSCPPWISPVMVKDLTEQIKHAATIHLHLEILSEKTSLESPSLESLSLGEQLGFSSESMDSLYAIGYHFFEEKQLEKAKDIFFLLCTLEPLYDLYWYCLGQLEQERQQWMAAIDAYAMASIAKPSSPFPHYNSGLCYEELSDFPQAKAAYELAIEAAVNGGATYNVIKQLAVAKRNTV